MRRICSIYKCSDNYPQVGQTCVAWAIEVPFKLDLRVVFKPQKGFDPNVVEFNFLFRDIYKTS